MPINLIPPKLKEQRKSGRIMGQFLSFLYGYLILFLILSGVLFVANIFIQTSIDKISAQITSETARANQFKEVELALKNSNLKLENVKNIDATRGLWSNVLTELNACTPTATQIKSISGDVSKKTVVVMGSAQSRTDIAKFKDKMEASSFFKNVNFSTSRYDETNGNYSFNLSSELEAIR